MIMHEAKNLTGRRESEYEGEVAHVSVSAGLVLEGAQPPGLVVFLDDSGGPAHPLVAGPQGLQLLVAALHSHQPFLCFTHQLLVLPHLTFCILQICLRKGKASDDFYKLYTIPACGPPSFRLGLHKLRWCKTGRPLSCSTRYYNRAYK
jgi:hypothetical protein